MKKKALVVVDMQNDFVDDKVLGNAECRAVIPNIKEKILSGEYQSVYFTHDTHKENYLETQEGKNLPVPHCILGTDGWKIVNELMEVVLSEETPAKKFHFICKNTFGSVDLAKDIQGGNYDEVELVGVCTGICVISNALLIKAFSPELKITVDSHACACVSKESHENALNAMKLCQIQII